MKHLRGFKKDDEGVSGAVTATLVIATLTLIFTGVYAIVVPVWVENAESNHMRQVSNDFTNMKKNIDSQIEQGDKPLTVSSTITLESDPTDDFFGVEGTMILGDLAVDPYSESFNISNAERPTEVYGTCQGAIYFMAKNQYYSKQTYIYANGAVSRVQDNADEKGVILTAPMFDVVDELGNRTLYFSTITMFGEPTTISGSKTVTVQTRTIEALIANYEGGVWDTGVNVTINAVSNLGYIRVYENFYTDRVDEIGLVDGTDYNITRSGDSLRVEIKNVNKIILYTGTVEIELK